tara:strand:- start:256 stop:504 length:249 start_codon:yes stop_codon:yes gene_type:complete
MILRYKKFKNELNERRYGGPKRSKVYRTLSPKMKGVIDDLYSEIEKSSNPVGQMATILGKISSKHNIKRSELEGFIDNEIIK